MSSEAAGPPVVVAADAARALGVGARVALGAARGGVAVVACWRVPGRRTRGPAVPRARRLAESLGARGVEAAARGWLVVVALPDVATTAIAVLQRVEAACDAEPCVPLLVGARDAAWEAVIEERGGVLLVGPDADCLALAGARLAQRGVRAHALAAPPGPVVRSLAGRGWLPPGTRALRSEGGWA